MNKFKIEKGISRINRVKLQATIEESIARDLALLGEWSNNDKNYIVNELLRFALSQDSEFQTYSDRVGQLCQRFGNRPITVAVEQVKGALVFMLSQYEPLHLFPVPPAMSANLREALYPSGAKDDPRDADLLVDLLWQHRDKRRRLSPDSEAPRRVQNLVDGDFASGRESVLRINFDKRGKMILSLQ